MIQPTPSEKRVNPSAPSADRADSPHRPRVYVRRGVYGGTHPEERVVEFGHGRTQRTLAGGLIGFIRKNDGKLWVEVYSLDPDVRVSVHGHAVVPLPDDAARKRAVACVLLALRRLGKELDWAPQDVDTAAYFEDEGLEPPDAHEVRRLAQRINTEDVLL